MKTRAANRTLPLSEPIIGKAERDSMRKCLESGFVSSVGPMTAEFERTFAEYVGARYAIATSSGTAAIHVALHALGIGYGQTVIVPDLTFAASMNPVLYCGAVPELCDVNEDSWCLDPDLFEALCKRLAASGRQPAAVIPVHLYGCACDMKAIKATARRFEMKIIEDAAEALGSGLGGRQLGTFGHAGCFSFNGNKLITTGGGGMVVTDSSALAAKIRMLVNQAKTGPDGRVHKEMGFNYRMSSLAAALGLAQMTRIEKLLSKKRAIAERYRTAFNTTPSIKIHPEPDGSENSYWLYSITLDKPSTRNRLLLRLTGNGIQARKFFQPLHRLPYVKKGVWTFKGGKCTNSATGKSDLLAQTGLNLPSAPSMTTEEQKRVISLMLGES